MSESPFQVGENATKIAEGRGRCCAVIAGAQPMVRGLREVVRALSPGYGGICRVVQVTNDQFLFIYFFSSPDKVESSLR